jgi:hypothetical protein
MPAGRIYPIVSQAGIKRDGTPFASRFYINGQWCRFQRGLARKMGGYKQIIDTLPNIPRGIFLYPAPNAPNFYVYTGDFTSLKYTLMDQNGNAFGGLIDRTPAGFNADANNLWQFDQMYSLPLNSNVIIAHAAPNLNFIGNNEATPIYYGPSYANTPLIPTGQAASGGIAVFPPYLFSFGNSGLVQISNINDPTTISNTAFIASQKIVVGMPARGGNSSPSGLLWSLDSVIRVTAINTNTGLQFKFDTITNQSSILSSRSVIEYDGLYFWAGIDRFLVYNGIVQEIPNQMNINYFFYNNGTTGLNYAQRQKVWAMKVPQYGEIWWFYPSGTNTECNRAVIYNKRENSWYDTNITRGAGYFEQVFSDPVWADSVASGGTYKIWQHESGVDQNINGTLTAIDSFIQTGDLSWAAIDPSGGWTGVDRWLDVYRFEPDMLQNGNMTLTVNTQDYARATPVISGPYTFTPSSTKIDLRVQGREMNLMFESNAVGGFYEINQCLLYYRTGDARAS